MAQPVLISKAAKVTKFSLTCEFNFSQGKSRLTKKSISSFFGQDRPRSCPFLFSMGCKISGKTGFLSISRMSGAIPVDDNLFLVKLACTTLSNEENTMPYTILSPWSWMAARSPRVDCCLKQSTPTEESPAWRRWKPG
jgi:hypothetical protein